MLDICCHPLYTIDLCLYVVLYIAQQPSCETGIIYDIRVCTATVLTLVIVILLNRSMGWSS